MRVGIDVVAISRFENLAENKKFLEKHFTINELSYLKTRKNFCESLAGLFACKEAFLKAIQVGVLNGEKLTDVEIMHNKNGAPELVLSQNIKQKFNIKKTAVSISHDLTINTATAICIVE